MSQRIILSRLGGLLGHVRGTTASTTTAQAASVKGMASAVAATFPKSEVPKKNPLGEGKYIRTGAALIIGDEVLNGKTLDTNSNYFAKTMFDLGVEVKRIEIIPDEEEDESQLSSKYDFVLTSGGIGPTHDDITYQSIARAFDTDLYYHDECIHRMYEMGKHRLKMDQQTEEQKTARKRMALFPRSGEVLFVQENLWVPVVRMAGKVCILPGVPRLFKALLEGLIPFCPFPPVSERSYRHLIHTSRPESSIAPFLTSLSERVKEEGIRVGSYPKFDKGVDVSLIGRDQSRLKELEEEVCKELDGHTVAAGRLGEEQ